MSEPNHVLPALPPRRRIVSAISLAIAAAASGGARSADNPPPARELPRVVVETDAGSTYKVDQSSSVKYAAPLRDIPQTVTVIPQAVIQEQGAVTLRDVLRNSPGITFQAGEGGGGLPGDQNFTLRGFSARNSMFIDGIRDIGAYTRDAFAIEQVEIAKGPTATVAGRSSTAGAINQVTKTPQEEAFQALSLGLGDGSYQRGTLDINQPFGETQAVRLNLMYHDSEVAGRNVVENQRWGFAPSLALGLGTPTRLTASYLYLDEDNVPDYGLPWGAVTQNGVTYPTGAFEATPSVDQSNFYGLRDYDFEDVRAHVGTMEVQHDFSERFLLQNTLRYFDTDRNSAITSPRPPNRQLQRRQMGTESLTNQTNLRFSFAGGGITHSVVTGLEVAREKTDNRNSAQTTNQPQISDFFNPDPGLQPLGPMPGITGNPSEATVDTVGVYAFDTLALNDHWQLSGGLRWDNVDVDYELTTLATGAVTTVRTDDSLLSWQAGVVYKPVEAGSVYLSYGTAFDPSVDAGTTGASLATAANSANDPALDPEESRNYELGTKWELADQRLLLSAAVFRMEKTNARTRTTTNEPFVLTGKQRVDGLEVGVTGNVTDNWSVFGGYVHLDSEIAKSANPVEESRALLLTPKNSANLWTTWRIQDFTVGAGAQFLDTVVRSRNATTGVEIDVPSYWLFEAMASYAASERVTLRLNIANLTDEKYVDRVGGGHYVPGPTRSAWVTADIRF